ncbi:MAG: hypothetical protein MPK06_03215 [Alphaproteobacteria bacterium]|nr:hypothetical protein [Alphaproteobacteria bacterium]MDA8004904.1 hypothetical protein [Alphaproteobacteria bacterium]MDA8005535.1 hypothetical protein [Alphaproteobacteria bacterium]MDA8012985.1 hypothetical protein [Alphaproteobacteria bacterium]
MTAILTGGRWRGIADTPQLKVDKNEDGDGDKKGGKNGAGNGDEKDDKNGAEKGGGVSDNDGDIGGGSSLRMGQGRGREQGH